MKIRSFFIKCFIITAISLSFGCLVPEKFTADVIINNDKGYSFSYKGTMIETGYRKMFSNDKSSNITNIDEVADKIQKKILTKHGDTFKSIKHLGNFIFEIEYFTSGKLTKTYHFPYQGEIDKFYGHDRSLLSFTPETNETIVVKSNAKDKDWDKLKKAGIKVNGLLRLKTDAKVLEHNAPKTPGIFSNTYEWEIGPGKPLPHMILKSGDSE